MKFKGSVNVAGLEFENHPCSQSCTNLKVPTALVLLIKLLKFSTNACFTACAMFFDKLLLGNLTKLLTVRRIAVFKKLHP